MKIFEPGYVYQLDQFDRPVCTVDQEMRAHTHICPEGAPLTLRFVNREPGTAHAGTQTQEVLRALIDHTRYCEPRNAQIIYHLRMALVLHEAQALERKVQEGILVPENIAVGRDGYFYLTE